MDTQEPLEFQNKVNLIINGQAGSDVVNLNDPQHTPTALTSITVNGDEPPTSGATSAGDILIVNGTGGADTVGINPTGPYAGNVTINSLPQVNFTAIEQLEFNAQGQDLIGNDTITYTTPGSNYLTPITFTPGFDQTSGSFEGGMTTGPFLVSYSDVFTGTLSFAHAGGSEAVPLTVLGTSGGGNVFQVSATTGTVQILDPGTGVARTIPILTPGISQLTLDSVGANNVFNVAGSIPFTSGLYLDGDATVNLTGATGAVTVNLGNSTLSTNTTITGYGGTVTLVGIDTANLNANGNTVAVVGTTGADQIAVTPTAAASATIQAYSGGTAQNAQGGTLASLTPLGPVFNATNVSTATGGFTINGNGGSDHLFVEGTQNADAIDVNDTASGPNAVLVAGLLAVNYNAALPSIEVDSLGQPHYH